VRCGPGDRGGASDLLAHFGGGGLDALFELGKAFAQLTGRTAALHYVRSA
jgi:hypothetical protein